MYFKNYILLFFLFLLITNKQFINIISRINGTVNIDGNLSNYGKIIQGIILVISYIIIELLISNELL
jgi:hypothetical protein